jgi:peptidoglycan hydrolase CwlO-like protein
MPTDAPAVPPIDFVEGFINQYQVLKASSASLTTQNAALTEENATLRANVEKLTQEAAAHNTLIDNSNQTISLLQGKLNAVQAALMAPPA